VAVLVNAPHDRTMSLKELRELRAWSVGDLARAAWLSTRTVAGAEAGTKRPQRNTLRRLAAALSLEPAELAAHLGESGAAASAALQRAEGARICSIPECPDPHVARGWCWRHYARWRKYGNPLAWKRASPGPKPPAKRRTREQRFWAHVAKAKGACWLWTGTIDLQGYGQFSRTSRRLVLAHRMAHELAHGPVPPGRVLANRCGTRACVNPQHWEVSTRADVGRRNLGRTRGEG